MAELPKGQSPAAVVPHKTEAGTVIEVSRIPTTD